MDLSHSVLIHTRTFHVNVFMGVMQYKGLVLEMSMNEVFIWLSGHRIIDREIFNG